MLRCLADSAITFCYLAKKGSTDDFARFKEYGQGQEKLLMLHLQDSHPGETSLEGRTAGDIGEELGPFAAEPIQIELGNWAKQDARKFAAQVGLEQIHRLVYSPASSDVHGSWLSLKHSNLRYCSEPLHRFHRLPSFSAPPLYLSAMVAALRLLQACIDAGQANLGFPSLEVPFCDLSSNADDSR